MAAMGPVKGFLAVSILEGGIRFPLSEEKKDHLHMTPVSCHHQGCPSSMVLKVGVCPMVEEQSCSIYEVVIACIKKNRLLCLPSLKSS